jgi:copper chaperone CopZ
MEAQLRNTQATAAPIVVAVGGMTCGGCSGKLQRLLQSEADVESAMVSHADNQATVIGAISLVRIHEIVEGAGFEVQG